MQVTKSIVLTIEIEKKKMPLLVGLSENWIFLKNTSYLTEKLPSKNLLVLNQQAKICCMGGVKLKFIEIIYSEGTLLCYPFHHNHK